MYLLAPSIIEPAKDFTLVTAAPAALAALDLSVVVDVVVGAVVDAVVELNTVEGGSG